MGTLFPLPTADVADSLELPDFDYEEDPLSDTAAPDDAGEPGCSEESKEARWLPLPAVDPVSDAHPANRQAHSAAMQLGIRNLRILPSLPIAPFSRRNNMLARSRPSSDFDASTVR